MKDWGYLTHSLHQIVDSIPDRAGMWMSKTLAFPDQPKEKYTIQYRDPLIAIQICSQEGFLP
jgi:hypothetical protein